MLLVSPRAGCLQYAGRKGTGSWQGSSDKAALSTSYTPSYADVRIFNHNRLVLSRVTLSFTMVLAVDNNRCNLGLHLKTEAKKLKVLGYFRRGETGWEFSQKAIDFIRVQYIIKSLSLSR